MQLACVLRKNVLVTSETIGSNNIARLSKAAKVYESWRTEKDRLETILPEVDVLVVFWWPGFLTREALARMKRLRFIQSILVGVNHIPFGSLNQGVVVASNAGAYSLEVGEHAWALLLASEKKVVDHHVRIRNGAKALNEFSGEPPKIGILQGKTLGIVGYGSIGQAVARYAKAFGMNVLAFARSRRRAGGVKLLFGRKGFHRLLRESDAVLLSVPLTRSTLRLIGGRELSLMKKNAVLVNIARGDLVDQKALYSHLTTHPDFKYATDAWWFKEGRETLETDFPFATLPNFVGTPHTSGPTGIVSGVPGSLAADNVLLYLKGKKPKHVVERSDYVGT
jgi:phosphoglycerate dehydrogenase-like enzyme